MGGKIASSFVKRMNRYVTRYLSSRFIFIMDLLLSFMASAFSLMIFSLYSPATISNSFVAVWLCSSVVASVIMFLLSKSYTIIIRHSSFSDLITFLFVCLGKDAILFLISVVSLRGFIVGLGAFIIADFFLTLFFLVMARIAMIFIYGIFKQNARQDQLTQKVLVYGTSDKAVALLTRLQDSPHYNIVGFITPNSRNCTFTVSEKPVYYIGSEQQFTDLALESGIGSILFATQDDARNQQDTLVRYANRNGVKVLLAPTIDEVEAGRGFVRMNPRQIRIEDLLGRPEIKISINEIKANFAGKTIMVTGAAGSIGSEICRQLAMFGVGKLILFDNAETPMHNLRLELEDRWPDLQFVPVIGDVRSPKRLDFTFRHYRPQIVFHAAAYKHVPLMEENPCEAVYVNVRGSRIIADKCLEYDVEKMVMISTDKAVNPTNIMGCSKRLAEIYVQSLGLALADGRVKGRTKFITTRFGNVLGSNGSVIPRFREQLENGGPITVTHPDITRFFMTIPEACRLVMEAATISTGNQILVFDMGESVKINDLAVRMIELAGYEPGKDIMIEYTGLRPGEKLYEEVLASTEGTDPSTHDRIRIARVRDENYEEVSSAIDELIQYAEDVRIPELVQLMKKFVPEFKSNNSRFEMYDK